MARKKRKKKSKLQKRKDNPNSTLWRNKADKLWRSLVAAKWNNKCAICGATEYVQAHHLIPREMKSHRHVVKNGILLCASHHKYSFEISPHKAPIAFITWLMKEHEDIWEWVSSQTPSRKCDLTYKESTTKLDSMITEEED